MIPLPQTTFDLLYVFVTAIPQFLYQAPAGSLQPMCKRVTLWARHRTKVCRGECWSANWRADWCVNYINSRSDNRRRDVPSLLTLRGGRCGG